MKKERVDCLHNGDGNHKDILCTCGNTPTMDGFFPCDNAENQMAQDIGSNWDNLYVCGRCGRIINQATLEVVGHNPQSDVLVPAAD